MTYCYVHFKLISFSYVFWFGDFNYRIDLPDEEVRRAVIAKELDRLLQYDQVMYCLVCGNI